jgi:hypothetical protein
MEAVMPLKPRRRNDAAVRVARHRWKQRAAGVKRMDVAVPAADSALLKEVAAVLRAGGEPARRMRQRLHPVTGRSRARTGRDLVAFFRSSPLVGEELDVARDRSPGRAVDL